MKIEQIKYFVSVYECGSFSAAAKERFVSTQAVSKSIAELERETTVPLFIRRSRRVEPTEVGKAFYTKATDTLLKFEELEAFARSAGTYDGKPRLRLGLCSPRFGQSDRAVRQIADFATRSIGVRTEGELIGASNALHRLKVNEFHALITIGTLNDPDTDCLPLGTVPTGVIMDSNHPLAHQDSVTVEEIEKYPMAFSEEFDNFNDSILRMYLKRGLKAELATPHTEEETLVHLRKNKGLAFTAIVPPITSGFEGNILKPLSGKRALSVPICFVSNKGPKPPAFVKLEQYLTGMLSMV